MYKKLRGEKLFVIMTSLFQLLSLNIIIPFQYSYDVVVFKEKRALRLNEELFHDDVGAQGKRAHF